MSDSLVLYIGDKNVSSWSMRAFVAVVHKGAIFEERTIPLAGDGDRRARREISPTGRVPVLHHGSVVVPDSLAILEYLEEAFPPPRWPALWPVDPARRAHARWLSATMHAHFLELRRSLSFHLCFAPSPPTPTTEALAQAQQMLDLWEDALVRNTEPGPYLFGAFGGVDAMFAPVVVRLAAFRVPMRRTPRAVGYMNEVLGHHAVRRWMDAARELPPVDTE